MFVNLKRNLFAGNMTKKTVYFTFPISTNFVLVNFNGFLMKDCISESWGSYQAATKHKRNWIKRKTKMFSCLFSQNAILSSPSQSTSLIFFWCAWNYDLNMPFFDRVSDNVPTIASISSLFISSLNFEKETFPISAVVDTRFIKQQPPLVNFLCIIISLPWNLRSSCEWKEYKKLFSYQVKVQQALAHVARHNFLCTHQLFHRLFFLLASSCVSFDGNLGAAVVRGTWSSLEI